MTPALCPDCGRKPQFHGLCPECGGCMYKYSRFRCRPCKTRYDFANPPVATAPDRTPEEADIAYAAGFYEGEGYVGMHSGTLRVTMAQKYIEPLERIRTYFGGNIRPATRDGMFYLNLYGLRSWIFLRTIGPYLSPRRIDQANRAAAQVVAVRDWGEVVPSDASANQEVDQG